jgi:hypothetical protein
MSLSCRSPIPREYFASRDICLLTQLFGENKNNLFYGPNGHDAWDMQTKGALRFIYDSIKNYVIKPRISADEVAGLIPILAAHDGYVSSPFNEDRTNGIYVYIETPDHLYRTMYFHLNKVRVWKDDEETTEWEKRKGKNFVKAGSVIGWGGNTGKYTTGAHLHFRIDKKIGGKWVPQDPLPYMQDETIYQIGGGSSLNPQRYFYKGEEITKQRKEELAAIINQ